MGQLADEVDEAVKEAKEDANKAKREAAELSEGVDADLKMWITVEMKKLEAKMGRFDVRLARATNLSTRFREEAKVKEAAELSVLETKVLAMLRYHRNQNKLKNEQLFAEVDASRDEKVDESDFIAFFKKCEKEPKKKPDDKAKEGEEKEEDDGDGTPSDEDLAKVFNSFDDADEGFLT